MATTIILHRFTSSGYIEGAASDEGASALWRYWHPTGDRCKFPCIVTRATLIPYTDQTEVVAHVLKQGISSLQHYADGFEASRELHPYIAFEHVLHDSINRA